jgi:hypothetical protein
MLNKQQVKNQYKQSSTSSIYKQQQISISISVYQTAVYLYMLTTKLQNFCSYIKPNRLEGKYYDQQLAVAHVKQASSSVPSLCSSTISWASAASVPPSNTHPLPRSAALPPPALSPLPRSNESGDKGRIGGQVKRIRRQKVVVAARSNESGDKGRGGGQIDLVLTT